MTISETVRLQVRERANCSCEFCGVTETDVGGELTIDHFRPQSKGGADEAENLVYCCQRCNQYKADYWPTQGNEPALWNPRQEALSSHLLTLADGTLYPITPTGTFTLSRLRLNRPPLIAHRLRRHNQSEEQRLLARYRDLVAVLEQLQTQQVALLEEQRILLEEQRALLQLLLKQR
jgi:HNH endonuclease